MVLEKGSILTLNTVKDARWVGIYNLVLVSLNTTNKLVKKAGSTR